MPNAEQARTSIMSVWSYANIVKISEEEFRKSGIRLLVVTHGARGAVCITPDYKLTFPRFKFKVVDTTGAGNGFVAGFLVGLVNNPMAFQSDADLSNICKFANAVGALTTTKRGVIPALLTLHDVRQFQQSLK